METGQDHRHHRSDCSAGDSDKLLKEINVRALVLDGDPTGDAAVVEHLRGAAYETITATSIQQAREVLRMHRLDLVVLDLNLPDGSGLAFCHELRERLGDRMIIIFLSANSTPRARAAGIELGADDFVAKPYDAEELLTRIKVRQRSRLVMSSQ